ncbi:MAG: VCBS repeat-containing protein [Abditibacteriales bacterium]|nr:VCBS repeat-containing protein [Abditibacteriales bacterium]
MRNEAFQHLLRVFCALAVGVATVGCGKTRLSGSNVAAAAREETKQGSPQSAEIVRAFTDVTERAGVAWLHHKPIFEAKVKNIEPWLASVGAAAAASDYDNDGDVDLYVTNSRKGFPNALYRNNGDGTFSDVAQAAGVANVNDKDGLSMDAVWGECVGGNRGLRRVVRPTGQR